MVDVKEAKQQGIAQLASLLRAEQVDDKAITLVQGQERIRIEIEGWSTGTAAPHVPGNVQCVLESAEAQSAAVGYRQDPRRRVEGRPTLVLRAEKPADQKHKRWGLNREVQTADAEFDELVYIESEAPDEHVKAVLHAPETLSAVKTLLESGCQTVGINEEDHKLVVTFHLILQVPELAARLERIAEQVVLLRASLPLFVGDTQPIKHAKTGCIIGYAFLALVLALISGFVTSLVSWKSYPTIDTYPVFVMLGIGLGVWLLFMPVAFLLARGRSRGAKQFFWLAGTAFFGLPLFTYGLGGIANSAFDSSLPQKHRVVVTNKQKRDTQKDSHPYRLLVRSWRKGGQPHWLSLNKRELWNNTKPGDKVDVVVGPGLFGWEWLVDVRAANDEDGG